MGCLLVVTVKLTKSNLRFLKAAQRPTIAADCDDERFFRVLNRKTASRAFRVQVICKPQYEAKPAIQKVPTGDALNGCLP